jgi:hypothetical protein
MLTAHTTTLRPELRKRGEMPTADLMPSDDMIAKPGCREFQKGMKAVEGFLATVGSTEGLMIAGGRQSSHLASSSLNMFHVGNKNSMKMFPIGNTAPQPY